MAIETLASVARTESGFDSLTLHDDSIGRTYHPATLEAAIALGVELATVDGHSVDVGLMQINSANFPTLGLSVADALDPCRSLAAADRVLVDDYSRPGAGQDTQPAVERALSRYNTGDPTRGLENGYVRRVEASAELVVPALRVQGDASQDRTAVPSGDIVRTLPLPPLPPSWDVYARAKADHGLVFGSPPAPAVAAPAPAAPTQAHPIKIEAMNDAR